LDQRKKLGKRLKKKKIGRREMAVTFRARDREKMGNSLELLIDWGGLSGGHEEDWRNRGAQKTRNRKSVWVKKKLSDLTKQPVVSGEYGAVRRDTTGTDVAGTG